MRKLILLLCCTTFIFMNVVAVYAKAPKTTDDLPTQYYSFKMVYQMLLFEISKTDLILRLPGELAFMVVTLRSEEKMKKITLSDALAQSVTGFAESVRGDVSETYVIQGIDEFINYINTRVGKSFYEIYHEIMDQPIATLNKVNADIKSDEFKEVETFTLMGNYPNPFNPGTTIEYSLPEDSFVKVVVYNTLGQEIALLVNEKQQKGIRKIQWDGKNSLGQLVPSGNYFYRFEIGGQIKKMGKMILIK